MRPVICYFPLFATAVLSFTACVPTGKFKAMQQQAHLSDSLYIRTTGDLNTCRADNADLNRQKVALQEQNKDVNQQLIAASDLNGQLRRQLNDLSAVSSAQAESIKRSLDNMGAKDTYIIQLHSAVTYRDSINLAVLLDLKQAIGGYGDQDVSIKMEKGAVNVDLSDSVLFNGDSTSYTIGDKGKQMLGRMARALNDQPDVSFTVESRTDSLAGPQQGIQDNWDLSLKRASAIVRILQNNYRVAPDRITAAARSQSRRTRVIILPRMDRLMQLLEHGQGNAAPSQAVTSSPS